jgi:prophage maintenance system killer protein
MNTKQREKKNKSSHTRMANEVLNPQHGLHTIQDANKNTSRLAQIALEEFDYIFNGDGNGNQQNDDNKNNNQNNNHKKKTLQELYPDFYDQLV